LADTKQTGTRSRTSEVWSDEEKAAMRESARERQKSAKLSPEEQRAQGERDVQEKIAEMTGSDREMAERLHELVMDAVPSLAPRTYYGMPGWARDGKLICFFQPASKFKVRYATFGFQPDANLDDGTMWATSFALLELNTANEKQIVELVKKAAS
jgi:uncharacterized protein YdhG (YjbR/CyaY superfamily)